MNPDHGVTRFVGVDLHVHTPASSCYVGPKTDQEYLDILRRYVAQNVKVIAITDHNTLKGYKRLLSLREDLAKKYSVLSDYILSHPDLEPESQQLKSDLELFSQLLVLPGVEFEADPGIHLLMIFDPQSDLRKVDEFLEGSGYTSTLQGQENPNRETDISCLRVLEQSQALGALVIAAHADSDKGVLSLKEFRGYRARVLRSSQLTGLSYNSPSTVEKVRQLLQNKEYRRENPIALIQCSDNHGERGQVDRITYFRLKDLSFGSVCTALKNPNECISPTEDPEITGIIARIIEDEKTITVEDLSEPKQKFLRKAFCAILNDGYGMVVVGAKLGLISGIERSTDYHDIIGNIVSSLRPSRFFLEMSTYPFGPRFVLVIRLSGSRGQVFFLEGSDKCYVFRDRAISEAHPADIADLVESRILNRLEEYQGVVQGRIDRLVNELRVLRANTQQFLLVNRLEKMSDPLHMLVHAKAVESGSSEELQVPEIANGDSSGTVAVVEPMEPRLPCTYLRCSCPRTGKVDLHHPSVKTFKGPAIVLVRGGGAYVMECEDEWGVVCTDPFAPALVLKPYRKSVSLYGLLGWLKSSALLWYVLTISGTTDICRPDVFEKLMVPPLKVIEIGGEVEELVRTIIEAEFKFLDYVHESKLTEEEQFEVLDNHNMAVDAYARAIDAAIFRELGLDGDEIEMTMVMLRSHGVYDLIPMSEAIGEDMDKELDIETTIDEVAGALE